jgi:hypothetical protein
MLWWRHLRRPTKGEHMTTTPGEPVSDEDITTTGITNTGGGGDADGTDGGDADGTDGGGDADGTDGDATDTTDGDTTDGGDADGTDG